MENRLPAPAARYARISSHLTENRRRHGDLHGGRRNGSYRRITNTASVILMFLWQQSQPAQIHADQFTGRVRDKHQGSEASSADRPAVSLVPELHTYPQKPPPRVLLEVQVVAPVVFDHHLGLELAVLGEVVGTGRPQAGVVLAERRQVVPELCGRRQRQKHLTPPAVRRDLPHRRTHTGQNAVRTRSERGQNAVRKRAEYAPNTVRIRSELRTPTK